MLFKHKRKVYPASESVWAPISRSTRSRVRRSEVNGTLAVYSHHRKVTPQRLNFHINTLDHHRTTYHGCYCEISWTAAHVTHGRLRQRGAGGIVGSSVVLTWWRRCTAAHRWQWESSTSQQRSETHTSCFHGKSPPGTLPGHLPHPDWLRGPYLGGVRKQAVSTWM